MFYDGLAVVLASPLVYFLDSFGITWLCELFIEKAGTMTDLLPEREAITQILKVNPAVDDSYIYQKLKVPLSLFLATTLAVLFCFQLRVVISYISALHDLYYQLGMSLSIHTCRCDLLSTKSPLRKSFLYLVHAKNFP